MVRMGNVWERTTDVLAGRGGMLAGIAIPALFVPPVLAAAWRAYAPALPATGIVAGLLALVVFVAALWGQLALIAASSDPATHRPQAIAAANRRLGAAIGVSLVLGLLFALLFLPAVGLFLAAGFDWTAMAGGAAPSPTAPGMAGFGAIYVLIAGIVLLFVGARLVPLHAVILHERRGLGAIARSWRLTRGHSWRLLGVVLLFVVVVLIATGAAQSVVGLVARLLLGSEAMATANLIAAIAAQAASTALTLVAIVFSGQAYLGFLARDHRLHDRQEGGVDQDPDGMPA